MLVLHLEVSEDPKTQVKLPEFEDLPEGPQKLCVCACVCVVVLLAAYWAPEYAIFYQNEGEVGIGSQLSLGVRATWEWVLTKIEVRVCVCKSVCFQVDVVWILFWPLHLFDWCFNLMKSLAVCISAAWAFLILSACAIWTSFLHSEDFQLCTGTCPCLHEEICLKVA